jgi:hypothetical protein
VIHEAHIAVGHGGRTRMIKELNRKYKNVTVESIVTYLRHCEPCQEKKTLKKGFLVKPILYNEMNSRWPADLFVIYNLFNCIKIMLQNSSSDLYTVKELTKCHIIWTFLQLLGHQTFSTPTTGENFATKSQRVYVKCGII